MRTDARATKSEASTIEALRLSRYLHWVDDAELESQNGGHAVSHIKYKRLKRARPGSHCRNLKFSTIFSYLNSAERISRASRLGKRPGT